MAYMTKEAACFSSNPSFGPYSLEVCAVSAKPIAAEARASSQGAEACGAEKDARPSGGRPRILVCGFIPIKHRTGIKQRSCCARKLRARAAEAQISS